MGRHREDWWAERLEELAQGGNAEEIARRHGVRLWTLLGWRSQLRKKSPAKSGKRPRLLPVVVRSPTRPVRPAHESVLGVFVEVGTTRMTLRGAVTAKQLAASVAASSPAC